MYHKIKLKFLLIGGCLFISSSVSASGFDKSNDYLKICAELSSGFNKGYCLGYIRGHLDHSSDNCVPENIKADQVRKIWLKYLKSNSDKLNQSPNATLTDALRNSFACN